MPIIFVIFLKFVQFTYMINRFSVRGTHFMDDKDGISLIYWIFTESGIPHGDFSLYNQKYYKR